MKADEAQILLGGGCFWCLEAVFKRVAGVTNVTSGYAGGNDLSPSYQKVCRGDGGHAEVVLIEYDSSTVKLGTLLSLFFAIHDPTTLNQQGNDRGIQYRSFIATSNIAETQQVHAFIKAQQSLFSDKIVTELLERVPFYPAEIEHKDYYEQNTNQPYCQIVVKAKLDKFIQWKNEEQADS